MEAVCAVQTRTAWCLRETMQPKTLGTLKEAQEDLERGVSRKTGYIPGLLKISVTSNELSLRKAASLVLKKEVDESWKPLTDGAFHHSQQDKGLVRSNLVFALIECRSLEIMKHLSDVLAKVATRDYPQDWPELDTTINWCFEQSGSIEHQIAALTALEALNQHRKHTI